MLKPSALAACVNALLIAKANGHEEIMPSDMSDAVWNVKVDGTRETREGTEPAPKFELLFSEEARQLIHLAISSAGSNDIDIKDLQKLFARP